MAASIGLVLYFVGAIVSHVRVGDMNGIGPTAFMLIISVAALVLRVVATSRASLARSAEPNGAGSESIFTTHPSE